MSPRPHDTGMVTMVSQTMSEMELHVRAILGLPVPEISCRPGASVAVLAEGDMQNPTYEGVAEALEESGTHVRIFGKPEVIKHRRMAVVLAVDDTTDKAREKAKRAASKIRVVEG